MSDPVNDNKPLLQRKKGTASKGTAEESFPFRDVVLEASAEVFKKGHGVEDAEEFFTLMGISLQGMFVLQYLFGADVLPFNRDISIQGEPAAGKSLMAWCIGKMFLDNKGYVCLVETERKTSPEQIKAVLQCKDTDALNDVIGIMSARSTESMLAKMKFWLTLFQDKIPKKSPCLLIVDSFSNPTTEKTKEKVKANGIAPLGYDGAKNAALITSTMKALAELSDTGPVTKILTHHEKKAIGGDDNAQWGNFGGPETTISGGIHHQYASTLTLQVTKAGRKDTIKNGSRTTHYLKGVKIAIGLDNRKVPIVVWDYLKIPDIKDIPEGDDPLDHSERVIEIDWGHSLMLMLKGIYEDNYAFKGKISKTDVKEITGVQISGNSAWCIRMDIKEADKIPFPEMGKLLQEDTAVISRLQKIMHIKHYTPWDEILEKHNEDPKKNPLPYEEVKIEKKAPKLKRSK